MTTIPEIPYQDIVSKRDTALNKKKKQLIPRQYFVKFEDQSSNLEWFELCMVQISYSSTLAWFESHMVEISHG